MSTRLTYTSGSAAPETDAQFEAALQEARSGRSEPLPHVVGGVSSFDGEPFERRDPSRLDVVASRAHEAPSGLVTEAVARARAAQPAWRQLGAAERCALLRKAGEAERLGIAARCEGEDPALPAGAHVAACHAVPDREGATA